LQARSFNAFAPQTALILISGPANNAEQQGNNCKYKQDMNEVASAIYKCAQQPAYNEDNGDDIQ